MEDNESNHRDEDKINTTAGLFSSLLLDQLNVQDVSAILTTQSQIIKRLDQTNKTLSKTNQLSTETFNAFALKDFQSYITLLNKMKNDLNYIFKHIRIVKGKLQAKYPNQYEKAFKEFTKGLNLDDFDEFEFGDAVKTTTTPNVKSDDNATIESQYKERSMSNESNSSTLSASKSLLVNLFETARTRLGNLEFTTNGTSSVPDVNNTTPNVQNSATPTGSNHHSHSSSRVDSPLTVPFNTPVVVSATSTANDADQQHKLELEIVDRIEKAAAAEQNTDDVAVETTEPETNQ